MPSKEHPLYDWMLIQYQTNMASYYSYEEIPDSALFYAFNSLETNKKVKSVIMEYNARAYIGSAYSLMGNYDLADKNFEESKLLVDQYLKDVNDVEFYRFYLQHLRNQNKFEDIRRTASSLVQRGHQKNFNNLILLAASNLREYFELKNQYDSAYFYARLESKTDSLIYNQDNLSRLETLKFGEVLRKLEEANQQKIFESKLRTNILLGSSFTLLVIVGLLYWNNRQKQLSKRKVEIAYGRLQNTQSQLIHSEKMASLGELTAGIAHEIQNPLNFVNNFSDVNKELVNELEQEIEKGDKGEIKALLQDLRDNEEKVTHHGKRAEGIVKSMLQHSRGTEGQKELTDMNALCDEYLRLAYHGFRAKDQSFNCDYKLELDSNVPKIEVVPQDIGRVLLNLINNAFSGDQGRGKTRSDCHNPLNSPLEGG